MRPICFVDCWCNLQIYRWCSGLLDNARALIESGEPSGRWLSAPCIHNVSGWSAASSAKRAGTCICPRPSFQCSVPALRETCDVQPIDNATTKTRGGMGVGADQINGHEIDAHWPNPLYISSAGYNSAYVGSPFGAQRFHCSSIGFAARTIARVGSSIGSNSHNRGSDH